MSILFNIAQVGTLKASSNLLEWWMVVVMLLVLFALAWIRVASPESFSQLGKGLFNIRLLRQLIREEGTVASLISRLLGVCFFLIIAMAIYLAIQVFNIPSFGLTGLALYGVLIAGLITMYVLKIAGILIFRFLVGGDYGLNEMIFNLVAHNNVVGLMLFPIVLITAVIPNQVYDTLSGIADSALPSVLLGISGFIVLLAYLSRLTRAMINSVRLRLSSVYIIFYLCTLEFLPLALLVKALKG